MKPNVMRVGRSAFYERREIVKPLTARQRAELEICLHCQTDPRQCSGECNKIKNAHSQS